jgi:non-ribosomal peptide synthetase component E (peptide arylation enzyme)
MSVPEAVTVLLAGLPENAVGKIDKPSLRRLAAV